MATPLPSYLKAYRKSAGLSQHEVAELLGFLTHKNVWRYERAGNIPSVEIVLTLELIFDARAADLFPIAALAAESRLLVQADTLLDRLERQGGSERVNRKRAHVASIKRRIEARRNQEI